MAAKWGPRHRNCTLQEQHKFSSKLRYHACGRTFNSFDIEPGDVQPDPPQKIQKLAIDIGSFVSSQWAWSFLRTLVLHPAGRWSHEKHDILKCLKGCSKPFQNGQWFTVIQAILGPMSFKQVNGLSRSETVVTFLSRCFTFFHAMCRPTWQFIKLLSHSYLSIGNLIPSVHWLPRQEGGVHYSHDRFHTLHVHVMWLIQTGWDETSRF